MTSGWIVPDWPVAVRAAVSTRSIDGASQPPFDAFNLGAHCGDDPIAVTRNRMRLVADLALPQPPRWLSQVHGRRVVRIARRDPFQPEQADAAVTADRDVVLAILTADCLPVLLAAADGSEVGAAHAGWRGLAGGVIEATIAAMRTPASALVAWLGPAIGADAYEVGNEVRAAFIADDAEAGAVFRDSRPGHWFCDLYALARRRLAACGVTTVSGGGFDTFADPRFYSYRREPRTGRFASLVWMPH